MLEQTRAIPVVFVIVADPVGSGFVQSLARPGANATGFTIMEPTIAGKLARAAQGDCAARQPGRLPVQSGYDAISGHLLETIQSRRFVLSTGSDCRAYS
jgi:hypothetical protein